MEPNIGEGMAAEFFQALFYAFGLLFLAELGDKTQLIILTLASKGRSSKKLAIGASLGFAAIVVLGGLIAILLSNNIDLPWITFISGIIFVILGAVQIFSLIKKEKTYHKTQASESLHQENEINQSNGLKCDEECETEASKLFNKDMNDYAIGFMAIFTMEMGDKTQVMTIVLAASSASPIVTLLGAWLALSLLAFIGAFAGSWLSKKVPKKTMDWIAALLFFIIGVIMMATAF